MNGSSRQINEEREKNLPRTGFSFIVYLSGRTVHFSILIIMINPRS